MLCENCVHKNVCRYKSEFENLKNDIAKTTPTWASSNGLYRSWLPANRRR